MNLRRICFCDKIYKIINFIICLNYFWNFLIRFWKCPNLVWFTKTINNTEIVLELVIMIQRILRNIVFSSRTHEPWCPWKGFYWKGVSLVPFIEFYSDFCARHALLWRVSTIFFFFLFGYAIIFLYFVRFYLFLCGVRVTKTEASRKEEFFCSRCFSATMIYCHRFQVFPLPSTQFFENNFGNLWQKVWIKWTVLKRKKKCFVLYLSLSNLFFWSRDSSNLFCSFVNRR